MVLGVMPEGFAVLQQDIDVWLPLALVPEDPAGANLRYLQVVARVRPGVTAERLRAELATVGARLAAANPSLNRGWRPDPIPLKQELTGQSEHALLALQAAVGFLLLMACANVANLLLARGSGRAREIALRMALGAGRGRIAGQLLAESTLLALTGGILGLGLARAAVFALARFGPSQIPRLQQASADARGGAVRAGGIAGLRPAFRRRARSPGVHFRPPLGARRRRTRRLRPRRPRPAQRAGGFRSGAGGGGLDRRRLADA